MIRPIRAEEALEAVNIHGVATGNMKKGIAPRIINAWRKSASKYSTGGKQKAEPIVRKGQDPASAFASHGIGYKRITR